MFRAQLLISTAVGYIMLRFLIKVVARSRSSWMGFSDQDIGQIMPSLSDGSVSRMNVVLFEAGNLWSRRPSSPLRRTAQVL